MKKLFVLLIVLIVFILFSKIILAQDSFVPTLINYQGYLTDANGTPLTGSYEITFRLYDEASGSHPWLWNETQSSVNVENGLFNILLGSIDTLKAADLTGERYLAIKVDNEIEMIPRMRLASVAFSLRADEANNSNTLDNMSSESFIAAEGDTLTGSLVLTGSDTLSPRIIAHGTLATMNGGLQVLSKTGNAWVYKTISNESRFHPHWNSYNGSDGNTGVLELGYLVLNKKLHFAMLGGFNSDNLRVEIVDAFSGEVYYTVRMSQTLNYFEYKEIDTQTRAGAVVKIKAYDTIGGSWGWMALSDFFVE